MILDPATNTLRASWTKINVDFKKRIGVSNGNPNLIPSIGAALYYWDRTGRLVEMAPAVAKAIRDARTSSPADTELLGPESLNQADFISDMALRLIRCENKTDDCTEAPSNVDLTCALGDLINLMAEDRFDALRHDDILPSNVLPRLMKAVFKAISSEGYEDWPSWSKRRRVIYALKPSLRDAVATTLVSLFYDCGTCDLLTSHWRAYLKEDLERRIAGGWTGELEHAKWFFTAALNAFSAMLSVPRSQRRFPRQNPQSIMDDLEKNGASRPLDSLDSSDSITQKSDKADKKDNKKGVK